MRLRHIKGADDVIMNHPMVIRDAGEIKGHWRNLFDNDHPLSIEIGTGKGQFILALAKQNPDINYVGIEKYSSVLLRALEKYGTEEYSMLSNIRFLCMDAAGITDVFSKGEVQRIYLNFSDPWPKTRHVGRRLTSPAFLDRYKSILKAGGVLEFKTDNEGFFKYSKASIRESGWHIQKETTNLYADPAMNVGNVRTEYEERFACEGKKICKLVASP